MVYLASMRVTSERAIGLVAVGLSAGLPAGTDTDRGCRISGCHRGTHWTGSRTRTTSPLGPRTATSEGVKYSRLLALLVALAVISRSPAVAEQLSSRTDDRLRIGVTVDPICTVVVTPGEWSADEAVDVACRNLPESHPEPSIRDGGAATVVINF